MTCAPSIIAAVIGIAGAFQPDINAFIVAHPSVAAVLAGIGAIISHILPSPRQ